MNEPSSTDRSEQPKTSKLRRYLFATIVLLSVLLTAALAAGVRFEDGTIGAAGVLLCLMVDVTGYVVDFVRRRFQLGMKSMLVIVTIFAIIFGLFGASAYQARKQRAVVQAILRDGGRVQYDFTEPGRSSWIVTRSGLLAPKWMKKWLGDDMFGQITSAYLGPKTNSDLIPRLKMKGLTALTLNRRRSIDENMARNLGGLPQLESLNVGFTPFDDDDLKEIRKLRLTYLNLNRTYVTTNGLKHLHEMKTLRNLDLLNLNLMDRDVQILRKKLPHTKLLVQPIRTKNWTKKQLKAFRTLLQLGVKFNVYPAGKSFTINYTDPSPVSKEVAQQLNNLRVETLEIRGRRTTVKEVMTVSKQVKSLTVFSFSIRGNEMFIGKLKAQVKKALPKCQIWVD